MHPPKHYRISLLVVASLIALFLVAACNSEDKETSPETLENVARVLWMSDVNATKFPPDVTAKLNSPKNNEAAFGERMFLLLEDKRSYPDSFTPDYTDRYDAFSLYTDFLTPHQMYALTTSLGMSSSRGYQELPTDKVFTFPEDDRPGFGYQNGWHFFVGSVFAENGEEFGVEFMFWHAGLLPPPLAEQQGLTEIENQVVEMHLAVTRAGDRHYRAKPYIVAGTTGLIDFSEAPFDYSVGNNFMRSLHPDSLFPIQLRAWGMDSTQGDAVEFEIDIVLEQAKPYMLNGDKGMAPSCGGVGTLYYSVSNLPVDPARSRLKLNGQEYTLSRGKLWYDHQWGSIPSPVNPRNEALRAMGNLEPREPDGWEWIAVMFDDDTEIALSVPKRNALKQFYEQTGPTPPGEMIAEANGLYMDKGGSYNKILGSVKMGSWIKSTRSHDEYMATNTWYPNRVEVTMDPGVVPEHKRRFTLIPIVDSGQEGWFSVGWQYSEGAVYVDTPDGTRVGRGFLELTGYADARKQVLRIAGLPMTEEMMELLKIRTPSPELIQASEEYLEDPTHAMELFTVLSTCRGL